MARRTRNVRMPAALVWAGLALASGRAEIVSFSVDPARSGLELRGSVVKHGLNLVLNLQADGSLKTAAAGRLRAEVTTNGVRLLDGEILLLADSGVWAPDHYGAEGAAPACWGARAGAELGGLKIAGLVAGRFWSLATAASAELPLTAGEFPARNLRWHFSPTNGPVVDYRFLTTIRIVDPDAVDPPPATRPPALAADPEPILSAGRFELAGAWTNRTSLRGRLEEVNGLATLTVPVEAWTSFAAQSAAREPYRFDWILTGRLVAVAVPPLRLERSGDGLVIQAHPALRLQRATRLAPPDWADHAPPATAPVPATQAAEFFRAVLVTPAP